VPDIDVWFLPATSQINVDRWCIRLCGRHVEEITAVSCFTQALICEVCGDPAYWTTGVDWAREHRALAISVWHHDVPS
jgi:hypothetical protein